MNKHLLLSFGVDPTVSSQTSVESFQQDVTGMTSRVGIRTATIERPKPEPWPKNLQFDLRERIERRAKEVQQVEEAEKTIRDNSTRRQKIRQIEKNHRVDGIDQLQFFHQAIYGANPVKERFAHFWLNHFTVGASSGTRYVIGDFIQVVIDEGMSGSFGDLLYTATTHVGMLTYLDNYVNIGENSAYAKRNRARFQIGINDNLARELLELHTVSVARDYTENDIRELAKILAGWWPYTLKDDTGLTKISDLHAPYSNQHAEPGKKIVLGREYPSGAKALRQVTDDLAQDPLTIKHLSRKLCRHFLSDNPSETQIGFVENVWKQTDGDLPEIHKALIAIAFEADPKKFQTPLTWFLTMQRLSNASLVVGWEDFLDEKRIHSGVALPDKLMREMGQNYWATRQPDGFSALSDDWISSEHMERRIRLASMTYQFGAPKTSLDEMIEFVKPSAETRTLINEATDERIKFVLFFCSKEMLGV